MASFRSLVYVVYVVLLFSERLLTSISCQSLLTNQAALFIFGDSLFDAGNNNYINTLHSAQANYWPYGRTTFKFPTGRFSDGRIIPDFIAEYAWLPLIPPYLQPGNHQFTYGVNFASAGAGALVETNQGRVIDLKTQLNNLKNVEKVLKEKLGDAETEKILSRAVYLFSVGSNDYFYALYKNTSVIQAYTKMEYVNMVVGNITSVIKDIYKIGGRKFGFFGMAPLGCVPSVLAIERENRGSCAEGITELVKLHNNALSKLFRELNTQLDGFKYGIHDSYASVTDRINNPSRYGFKDGRTACCGSGMYRGSDTCGGKLSANQDFELCENASSHLFFDSAHPSEKAHQQLAELMWSGSPNVTGPYNLRTLFKQSDM